MQQQFCADAQFQQQLHWATQQSLREQQQQRENQQFEEALAAARIESEELAMLRECDQEHLSQKLDEVGLRELAVPRQWPHSVASLYNDLIRSLTTQLSHPTYPAMTSQHAHGAGGWYHQ